MHNHYHVRLDFSLVHYMNIQIRLNCFDNVHDFIYNHTIIIY